MSSLTKVHYYANKPYLSRAFQRIEDGIRSTLPQGVEMNGYMDSDLVIIPVIGPFDVDLAQDAVILQLCYETAGESPDYWEYVWDKAKLVVSYYDLPVPERLKWKFLRMPLGYDPKIFYPDPSVPKKYEAVVTGFIDGPRGEVIVDVWKAFGNIAHVGEDMKLGKGYDHFVHVSDAKMRELYQQSRYVVALRYIEGFELPIIEGWACGAQPVAFDLDCYTHWFDGIAHFVDPDEPVIPQLLKLDDLPFPVSDKQPTDFAWENVMKPFWARFKWLK